MHTGPSLFRSLKAGSKKEILDGGNSRTRTYYFRKCKKIRWSLTECVPDEVLFEILVRLPPQDIYFGASLVCRKWYHMTHSRNFIRKHLERASNGLFYKDKFGGFVFSSAREDGGGIDTCKLNYEYKNRHPVMSSWNGLMLECDRLCGSALTYYVTNFSTYQSFRLPRCPYTVMFYTYSGIGYDAASMTYKVVAVYGKWERYMCGIFTLGVDKSWRIVCTDHLSNLGKNALLSCPIITEGFLHWKRGEGTEVVTLNLETEIITATPPPVIPTIEKGKKIICRCLSTGRYLSLFLQRGKLVWEVFEMKPETGEWKKLLNICLEGQKGKIKRLGFIIKDNVEIRPWGWLKYPDMLVFRQHFTIIFYNPITCEIGDEKLSINKCYYRVTPHKNSLVWLGGS